MFVRSVMSIEKIMTAEEEDMERMFNKRVLLHKQRPSSAGSKAEDFSYFEGYFLRFFKNVIYKI